MNIEKIPLSALERAAINRRVSETLTAIAADIERECGIRPAEVSVAPIEAANASAPTLSGDACRDCGSFSMLRTGTCLTCQACGSTSGCA